MAKVMAPFSADQVASLNGYQRAGTFHEYTCRTDECLDADGERSVLIAAPAGWVCPVCDYTQDWAMGPMADWSWQQFAGITVTVDGATARGEIAETES